MWRVRNVSFYSNKGNLNTGLAAQDRIRRWKVYGGIDERRRGLRLSRWTRMYVSRAVYILEENLQVWRAFQMKWRLRIQIMFSLGETPAQQSTRT